MARRCLVITSIARPTAILRRLAAGAQANGVEMIVIGDQASPDGFALNGCDYYGLEQQRRLDLRFAQLCPTGHYARKNIGYLLAMERGADTIVETDDDTVVHPSFWRPPGRARPGRTAAGPGWVNVYRYFSEAPVWPRGFPLDEVGRPVPPLDALPVTRNEHVAGRYMSGKASGHQVVFWLLNGHHAPGASATPGPSRKRSGSSNRSR